MVKLDPGGSYVWGDDLGSAGGQATGGGLAIDGSGNLYFTGSFSGTVSLNYGYTSNPLTSSGANNIYVGEISGVAGVPMWSTAVGGSASDVGMGIAVDCARQRLYHGLVQFAAGQLRPRLADVRHECDRHERYVPVADHTGPGSGVDGLGLEFGLVEPCQLGQWPGSHAGANLEFDFGAAQFTSTNDLAPGTLINSIIFVGSGYTINGQGVTLGPGGIQANPAGGSDSFQPTITLPSGYNTHFSVYGGTLLLNGSISGPGGMTESGSGTLIVNGADSFTGARHGCRRNARRRRLARQRREVLAGGTLAGADRSPVRSSSLRAESSPQAIRRRTRTRGA